MEVVGLRGFNLLGWARRSDRHLGSKVKGRALECRVTGLGSGMLGLRFRLKGFGA